MSMGLKYKPSSEPLHQVTINQTPLASFCIPIYVYAWYKQYISKN